MDNPAEAIEICNEGIASLTTIKEMVIPELLNYRNLKPTEKSRAQRLARGLEEVSQALIIALSK